MMGSETTSEWRSLCATQHPFQVDPLTVPTRRGWGVLVICPSSTPGGKAENVHPSQCSPKGSLLSPGTASPEPTLLPSGDNTSPFCVLLQRSPFSRQRLNRTGGHGHALEVFMDFALDTEIQRRPPLVCHFLLSRDILKMKLHESAASHLF